MPILSGRGKEQPYLPVCYDAVEVFNGHPGTTAITSGQYTLPWKMGWPCFQERITIGRKTADRRHPAAGGDRHDGEGCCLSEKPAGGTDCHL